MSGPQCGGERETQNTRIEEVDEQSVGTRQGDLTPAGSMDVISTRRGIY